MVGRPARRRVRAHLRPRCRRVRACSSARPCSAPCSGVRCSRGSAGSTAAAFGAVGLMAEQNARRNPRRTAATASALMIGVSLVTMMAVLGASTKASLDKSPRRGHRRRLRRDQPGGTAVLERGRPRRRAGRRRGAGRAGARGRAPGRRRPRLRRRPSTPPSSSRSCVPTSSPATSPTLDARSLAISTELATDAGLAVGSTVTSGTPGRRTSAPSWRRTPRTPPSPRTSRCRSRVRRHRGAPDRPDRSTSSPSPVPTGPPSSAALDAVVADLPTVNVSDQAEFAASQREPIDQLLYIVYALLGLAVVIAILGIVNTLALSVIERVREIGLLRAVGLSRRQLRHDAAAGVGGDRPARSGARHRPRAGLRASRCSARSSTTASTCSRSPSASSRCSSGPPALVGVLAALWPGRRAARLDVLQGHRHPVSRRVDRGAPAGQVNIRTACASASAYCVPAAPST